MVRWLGFEPYKITYSSDHFDRLYELAEKLITLEKAYVCHCNGMTFIPRHLTHKTITDRRQQMRKLNCSAVARKGQVPATGVSMPSSRLRRTFRSSATCAMASTSRRKPSCA